MTGFRSFLQLAMLFVLLSWSPITFGQINQNLQLPSEWKEIPTYARNRVWVRQGTSAVLSWTRLEPDRRPSSPAPRSPTEAYRADASKRRALEPLGVLAWTATSRESKNVGSKTIGTIRGHYHDPKGKRIVFIERTIETPTAVHQLLYSRESHGTIADSEWELEFSKLGASE